MDAHHAIIPTPKAVNPASLSANEQKIYQQIARQYLMQFYPAAVYSEAKLEFTIAGGLFIARGRQLMSPGWRQLLGRDDSQDGEADLATKCRR
ncbi:DNA topoisomerase III [Photobacterium aphoticum]|uniref:DNA topoisomerase III n=1 Tax=Photobacterium aphoticum TaxID=754436 RepID=A0A090RJ49_9GAMM|nr:DNA topoisomerase III [Photobacterium aphoticum]